MLILNAQRYGSPASPGLPALWQETWKSYAAGPAKTVLPPTWTYTALNLDPVVDPINGYLVGSTAGSGPLYTKSTLVDTTKAYTLDMSFQWCEPAALDDEFAVSFSCESAGGSEPAGSAVLFLQNSASKMLIGQFNGSLASFTNSAIPAGVDQRLTLSLSASDTAGVGNRNLWIALNGRGIVTQTLGNAIAGNNLFQIGFSAAGGHPTWKAGRIRVFGTHV